MSNKMSAEEIKRRIKNIIFNVNAPDAVEEIYSRFIEPTRQGAGVWVKCSENWEDAILRGKHVRDIETKENIPYREIAKSESWGNKWVRCWTSPTDIKSYPAETLEYFDPSASSTGELREALERIFANPHGCRSCDAGGKLRNPNGEHDDDCPYLFARKVLDSVSPIGDSRETLMKIIAFANDGISRREKDHVFYLKEIVTIARTALTKLNSK